jgi:hypothetical protein
MQKRHRAGSNGPAPGRKSAPLDEVEPIPQFFDDLRDLKEIVAGIGIPDDDESAFRSGNSSHQCAAIARITHHYHARPLILSDSSRRIGTAVVCHDYFAGDIVFAQSLPSFLNATSQSLLLIEAGNYY